MCRVELPRHGYRVTVGNRPAVSESIVVTNDFAELSRVGEWVKRWARSHGVPPNVAGRVDVCAAELVTNIIEHGYADAAPHEIDLTLAREGRDLTLEIQDDGRGFDPLDLAEPERPDSLEAAKIGGLGIHLVRNLSDELRHRRSGGRNHLTIIFRLPGR